MKSRQVELSPGDCTSRRGAMQAMLGGGAWLAALAGCERSGAPAGSRQPGHDHNRLSTAHAAQHVVH